MPQSLQLWGGREPAAAGMAEAVTDGATAARPASCTRAHTGLGLGYISQEGQASAPT